MIHAERYRTRTVGGKDVCVEAYAEISQQMAPKAGPNKATPGICLLMTMIMMTNRMNGLKTFHYDCWHDNSSFPNFMKSTCYHKTFTHRRNPFYLFVFVKCFSILISGRTVHCAEWDAREEWLHQRAEDNASVHHHLGAIWRGFPEAPGVQEGEDH